jgi:hypothetical protein
VRYLFRCAALRTIPRHCSAEIRVFAIHYEEIVGTETIVITAAACGRSRGPRGPGSRRDALATLHTTEPGNIGLIAPRLQRKVSVAGLARIVAIALLTAPYLIPVCLTRARFTCVRSLSPSWLSARDNALRACLSPRAASALPYFARTWSLAVIISCMIRWFLVLPLRAGRRLQWQVNIQQRLSLVSQNSAQCQEASDREETKQPAEARGMTRAAAA